MSEVVQAQPGKELEALMRNSFAKYGHLEAEELEGLGKMVVRDMDANTQKAFSPADGFISNDKVRKRRW